ncbi:MAG TPA: diaminopimelate decarboxylase [Gemmatales bacterium]|nr:diaminopimelate decarboxylase [Gemmatales bacterium]
MDHFQYRQHALFCEDVPVSQLAAQYGTPLWVYSQATLVHHLKALQSAFEEVNPLICYSIKTNGNTHICRLMQQNGSGFDVTSAGELFRALQAGGTGEKIVFAGAGKSDEEIKMGLEAKVRMFNVESEPELEAINRVASKLNVTTQVALRVNPDVDPQTHPETSTGMFGTKFGLPWDQIERISKELLGHPRIKLVGLHFHLGSPILTTQPYSDALKRAVPLLIKLREQGHPITTMNCGGGFGINYKTNEALPATAFASVIIPAVKAAKVQLALEPGRFIAGNAGILVSKVIYPKDSAGKRFVIQDAAMNDLIRPRLYGSFHRIWPVNVPNNVPAPPSDFEADIPNTKSTEVVGPVCETGDYLARGRKLPDLKTGDLLATFSAGAYGMAMSSNYNGRLRAAEVLVNGQSHRLIRRRETLDDLIRCEQEI